MKKSPIEYFWVRQDFWAILGGRSGKRAQKWPIKNNPLSVPGQIGIIFVKNFQHVFRQLGQIRVSYFLDFGNLFLPKKIVQPKTQIWENRFWA